MKSYGHSQRKGIVSEPSLSELLNEPIIQDVMRSDRVRRRDVELLFSWIRQPGRGEAA